MKKLTAMLLALTLCFGLAACGGNTAQDDTKDESQTVQTGKTEDKKDEAKTEEKSDETKTEDAKTETKTDDKTSTDCRTGEADCLSGERVRRLVRICTRERTRRTDIQELFAELHGRR